MVFIALGLVIGVLSTIAGIGGGVFMVPLFYFLGLDISKAVGTSKFVIVFLSLIGAINYIRSRKVLFRISMMVLVGMIPFSYIGAYLSSALDKTTLKLIVSVFIIYYGLRLLYSYIKRKYFSKKQQIQQDLNPPKNYDTKSKWYIVVATGCFSGLIAGLTGTGGGVVNMPLFLSVLRMPIHYAIATSTFIIFPSSIVATIRHMIDNEINYAIALPFTIGAMIGANIGPRIALSLKPQHLRFIVGIILLIAGIRMLATVF
ncbi:sulfite exporter TauE/SafE family protein [Desulfurococcaceae archaeon MEX13E-LK6-19]|nr:sulfite exporter TauE/SafE family protein [Desulfurococcaceae archaeon MEX13E-LK6-19]